MSLPIHLRACAAACFALGLAAGAAAQTVATPQSPASLQPGDTVRIMVMTRPELTGSFAVGTDGMIRHPLYRGVVVTGVPLPAAEQRIGELLSQFVANPRFVVEPLFRVSLDGEVRRPGLYSLPPETTIAQALALAGGVGDAGRADHVLLFRDGTETVLDLSRPSGVAQTPIRSGDFLLIPRSRNVFREVIAPAAGVVAALGTLLNLLLK